ncbi:MAG TPA: translocation protein TolB [Terriglobales bacterium]|nr:translocation protein TolB [Terriglobales bacterium]
MKILRLFLSVALLFGTSLIGLGQADQITGTVNRGKQRVRIAAADFKPATADPNTAVLLTTFNQVLYSDLQNAGIFDVVSKSFNPLQTPGTPDDLTACDTSTPNTTGSGSCPKKIDAWANPPTTAEMMAFGNLGVSGGQVTVNGWLFDVKNNIAPQVLGKQYREQATQDNARLIAHEFADEIIFRLGGGIPGIAESKIVFISTRSGNKEVWMMDYDGYGQHQITHLGQIALSPRISPDSSRIAFVELSSKGVSLRMYSLLLNRMITFPHVGGLGMSPAWGPLPDMKLAFTSTRSGDPEIYTSSQDGAGLKRVTDSKGPDVSPVWNPKTGAEIAFVSSRATNLAQIFTMAPDGTNVQRLTDGGYAVSPSWSPDGQWLTFAWQRSYGPGIPGNRDIYVMNVANKTYSQLTANAGTNDVPSWSPDGRHIVFQSDRSGTTEIWTMLADGTQQHQLSQTGQNSQPNWSWK